MRVALVARKLLSEMLSQTVGVRGLAFPNRQNSPSFANEKRLVTCIALNIPLEFLGPEFDAALWSRRPFAVLMAVPEAAMHENYGLVP